MCEEKQQQRKKKKKTEKEKKNKEKKNKNKKKNKKKIKKKNKKNKRKKARCSGIYKPGVGCLCAVLICPGYALYEHAHTTMNATTLLCVQCEYLYPVLGMRDTIDDGL
jgi:malic enzyme